MVPNIRPSVDCAVRRIDPILEMVQASPRTRVRYHEEGSRALSKDYRLTGHALGHGCNGQVWFARSLSSNLRKKFAVKSFSLTKIDDVLNELKIHMTVDHPHIVPIVDVYRRSSKVHMVMECMEGGDLFDILQKRQSFCEADATEAIRQVLLAVRYLHKNHIVHRDLKPENILSCDSRGSHFKLTDFGLATWWKEGDSPLHLKCGTSQYEAPEMLSNMYTNRCDLWSVGVMTFVLLTGRPLFFFDAEKHASLAPENTWPQLQCLNPGARCFVQALLQKEEGRLTASQALQHYWLRGHERKPRSPDLQGIIQSLRSFHDASQLERRLSVINPLAPCGCHSDFDALFMEMDESGIGLVGLEALTRLLSRALGVAAEDQKLLQDVFVSLDRDSDGYVRYSELLAAMRSAFCRNSRACVEEIFKRFDTASAGRVTSANLQELLGLQGSDVEQELIGLEARLAKPSATWMERVKEKALDWVAALEAFMEPRPSKEVLSDYTS